MDRTSLCRVRLRENAVPTVFPAFPSHLQKPTKNRKPPKQRSFTSSSAAADTSVVPSDTAQDTSVITSTLPTNPSPPSTSSTDTPREAELKRKLSARVDELLSSQKKVKHLQQARRRLIKKMGTLSNIIAELRNKNLMGMDSLFVLEKSGGGVADLVRRQINKQQGKILPVSYSAELRSFALTLHFYSPKAYCYVHKVFDTCLPHPRTIARWYSSIDGDPGFTSEAFRALEVHLSKGNAVACALIMDERDIRQQVEWP
ncbi:hypothetical protein lerEdw1_012564 [Lerista edwardsae]|nr:hypothetical protein lerEdw1_012564 [Lerista edwardsae]